jgi:uncharacterized protein
MYEVRRTLKGMWFSMLLLKALTALCSGAFARTIDCDRKQSNVEQIICAADDLRSLDAAMVEAYNNAREAAKGAKSSSLLQDQRRWLSLVRDKCTSNECLKMAYVQHIHELDPFADKKITCDEMRRYPERIFPGGTTSIDLGSGHGSPIEFDYECSESLSR